MNKKFTLKMESLDTYYYIIYFTQYDSFSCISRYKGSKLNKLKSDRCFVWYNNLPDKINLGSLEIEKI